MEDDWVKDRDGGALLKLRVTPRASRNSIEAPADGSLPVKVTAPPAESKANQAVLKLLAKALGTPKSSLSITAGVKSRNKTVLVEGMSAARVRARIKG